MPRKPKTAHQRLKTWLIELGQKAGYESYSGDSESIDIRVKRKHIEYQPDVVWNWKGDLYIVELAFSEDWRAIVGEFLLVSMIKNCKDFLMVTVGDPEFTGDLFKIVGKKLDFRRWFSYTFEESDLENVDKMKREIRSYLKERRWI